MHTKTFKKTSVLIFSGSNDRAIIAFCRFAQKKDINFLIIARNKKDNIFKTIYRTNVIHTRNKEKINITDIIEYIKIARTKSGLTQKNTILILPATEYINRILCSNVKKLKKINICTGLPNKKIYEMVSDKFSFSKICKNFGIKTPSEYRNIPNKFPFVIKPKKYQNFKKIIDKPAIINNAKELNTYWLKKQKKIIIFKNL